MDTLLNIGLSNALFATALAVLVLVLGYAFRRRPALMHGLWLLVLLKLITPPLISIPVPILPTEDATDRIQPAKPTLAPLGPLPDEPAPIEVGPIAELPKREPGEVIVLLEEPREKFAAPRPTLSDSPPQTPAAPLSQIDWPRLLVSVWVGGAVAWLLLALVRIARFHSVLRFAEQAPHSIQERVRRLGESMGLRSPPTVWLVPGRLPPMVWALVGRARILLPSQLWFDLDEDQQQTLLAHELAHLRRRDHWVRPLELIVSALYWWFPLVWYARRELREAEEQCCDAWVVSILPQKSKRYAEALVETLEFLAHAPTVPALASGLGQVSDAKRRLTMILSGTTPRALTWRGWMFVGAVALLLPTLPSFAQRIEVEVEEKIEKRNGEQRPDEPKFDPADARKLLDRYRAELKKAEDELAKSRAEFERARRRLEQLRARFPQLPRAEKQSGQPREEKRIRIELRGDPKDFDLDKLKLDPMLKKRIEDALKKAPKGGNIRIELDKDLRFGDVEKLIKGGGPKRVQVGKDTIIILGNRFRNRVEEAVEPPENRLQPPPIRPRNPDRRIEDLERKLDDVMRELQQLRRQFPRRGGNTPPANTPPRLAPRDPRDPNGGNSLTPPRPPIPPRAPIDPRN